MPVDKAHAQPKSLMLCVTAQGKRFGVVSAPNDTIDALQEKIQDAFFKLYGQQVRVRAIQKLKCELLPDYLVGDVFARDDEVLAITGHPGSAPSTPAPQAGKRKLDEDVKPKKAAKPSGPDSASDAPSVARGKDDALTADERKEKRKAKRKAAAEKRKLQTPSPDGLAKPASSSTSPATSGADAGSKDTDGTNVVQEPAAKKSKPAEKTSAKTEKPDKPVMSEKPAKVNKTDKAEKSEKPAKLATDDTPAKIAGHQGTDASAGDSNLSDAPKSSSKKPTLWKPTVDLDSKTAKELREQLELRHLPKSGTKPIMIKRLQNAFNATAHKFDAAAPLGDEKKPESNKKKQADTAAVPNTVSETTQTKGDSSTVAAAESDSSTDSDSDEASPSAPGKPITAASPKVASATPAKPKPTTDAEKAGKIDKKATAPVGSKSPDVKPSKPAQAPPKKHAAEESDTDSSDSEDDNADETKQAGKTDYAEFRALVDKSKSPGAKVLASLGRTDESNAASASRAAVSLDYRNATKKQPVGKAAASKKAEKDDDDDSSSESSDDEEVQKAPPAKKPTTPVTKPAAAPQKSTAPAVALSQRTETDDTDTSDGEDAPAASSQNTSKPAGDSAVDDLMSDAMAMDNNKPQAKTKKGGKQISPPSPFTSAGTKRAANGGAEEPPAKVAKGKTKGVTDASKKAQNGDAADEIKGKGKRPTADDAGNVTKRAKPMSHVSWPPAKADSAAADDEPDDD